MLRPWLSQYKNRVVDHVMDVVCATASDCRRLFLMRVGENDGEHLYFGTLWPPKFEYIRK